LANAANSGLNLRIRLFDESGKLVATASDPHFTSLAGRGQIADFVTNVFPQLAGTSFKGTLSVDLGSGASSGSVAATALTVKEGLLSALPVIPGSIGGGGGGSTAAADCLNQTLYTTASAVHLEYNVSGASNGTSIADATSTLNVAFEGQTANEIKLVSTSSFTGQSPTTSSGKSYSILDGLAIVTYGVIADVAPPVSPVPGTAKSVYTPPARDTRYTLVNAGDSAFWSYAVKTTFTPTGSTQSVVTNSNQTTTVVYQGRESVTVPAGTFDTCKFLVNNATTNWIAVGFGVSVKNSSTDSTGTTTSVLRTGTVNGAAIQ
jgi:hypothetical protein